MGKPKPDPHQNRALHTYVPSLKPRARAGRKPKTEGRGACSPAAAPCPPSRRPRSSCAAAPPSALPAPRAPKRRFRKPRRGATGARSRRCWRPEASKGAKTRAGNSKPSEKPELPSHRYYCSEASVKKTALQLPSLFGLEPNRWFGFGSGGVPSFPPQEPGGGGVKSKSKPSIQTANSGAWKLQAVGKQKKWSCRVTMVCLSFLQSSTPFFMGVEPKDVCVCVLFRVGTLRMLGH